MVGVASLDHFQSTQSDINIFNDFYQISERRREEGKI